ncbi:MAG: hypothetical protein HC838_17965, partial [Spirulinaceae cyanobacterium RM2_2_10]|nr:hypothetical protein [Spirulinaceae cyanobacterium RM2_2_10]
MQVSSRFAAVPALAVTILSLGASAAIAQVPPPLVNGTPIELQTLPEAMERAATATSQDALSTVFTLGRQIDFLFGIGGFPEMEASRDASFIHEIYQDFMVQQFNNGPFLRTPDLPNPFNSSILTNPGLLALGTITPSGEFC